MFFRVTFSNNPDEHYKDNAMDTQMSMTVKGRSFENATIVAKAWLESMVFWPETYEVVAIRKIDLDPEEAYIKEEAKDARRRSKLPGGYSNIEDQTMVEGLREPVVPGKSWHDSMEPVKKAPELWCLQTGITVCDPDGWRGTNDPAWDEPITRDEFIKRASFSTCYAWPSPLLDE